jgi:spore germination cell wall hydrolase CwlJ-like protein
MIVRWAVALTAGFSFVAATTHAAPQSGAVIVRAAAQPANLITAPQVALDAAASDTPAPKDQTLESLIAFHSSDVDSIDPETECMAKVVHHEAGNQPLQGMLAVAEVIVNRTRSGRFPTTPCGVANQRGQFFQTASYDVPRSSERWRTAVAVARLAQAGEWTPVAPGALFFHAVYSRYDWSHRRTLVTRIADQIFYR